MPTASADNGNGGLRALALPVALDPAISAISFLPLASRVPMTWDAAFDANTTDGIIVLHHGKIVYERYAGCLDQRKTVIVFPSARSRSWGRIASPTAGVDSDHPI